MELSTAAGINIMAEHKKSWHYFNELVRKLTALTRETNASKLQRNIYISGRAKPDNEKGYYIADAINEAINEKRNIFSKNWRIYYYRPDKKEY